MPIIIQSPLSPQRLKQVQDLTAQCLTAFPAPLSCPEDGDIYLLMEEVPKTNQEPVLAAFLALYILEDKLFECSYPSGSAAERPFFCSFGSCGSCLPGSSVFFSRSGRRGLLACSFCPGFSGGRILVSGAFNGSGCRAYPFQRFSVLSCRRPLFPPDSGKRRH